MLSPSLFGLDFDDTLCFKGPAYLTIGISIFPGSTNATQLKFENENKNYI